MNPYQHALQRMSEMDESGLDARKELKDTRDARDEARQKSHEDDGLSRLPYNSRPDFLGERWKMS